MGKKFFSCILKVTEDRSLIRIHSSEVRISGSGSASKSHGSPKLDLVYSSMNLAISVSDTQAGALRSWREWTRTLWTTTGSPRSGPACSAHPATAARGQTVHSHHYIKTGWFLSSFGDPSHFGADPDPRICTSD